jgi:hypothetical protein
MKTKIILISVMILMVISIMGQEPPPSSAPRKIYSVNLQFGLNQIREKNLLPLVHKGTLTELSVETEKMKSGLRQFQASFVYSRLKTNLEEMAKSGNIKLVLNYSYNFQIYNNTNLTYYLGPRTSLCYSYMLYPNWDDSHGYWADYLSFGLNNVLSIKGEHEREWFTSLNIGLLSLYSRPDEIRPYKMDDSSFGGIMKALNSNIAPGTINKALQINFKAEYRFPVFLTKREAITYNLDLTRFSSDNAEPLIQVIHRFGLKIML